MATIADQRWHSVPSWWRYCALILLSLCGGCASKRDQIAQALGSGVRAPAIREVSVEDSYRLAYPDTVEIAVAGMPQFSGQFAINVDGRIDLASLDNPRIDGQTVPRSEE